MEQILLRAREAAELCSVKVKTWRAWNQLGKIPKPVKLGRLQFWRHDELLRWVEEGCPNRKFWGERDEKESRPNTKTRLASSRKQGKV